MKTIISGIFEVRDAAPLILEAANGIQYAGKSQESDDGNLVDQVFTLDEMCDAYYSEDNCHYTTDFLLSGSLLNLIDAPHERARVYVTCEYGQNHVAVLLKFTETGEDIVLDFTASQYVDDVAFPLVLRKDDWFEFVKANIDGTAPIMEELALDETVRW